MKEFFLNFVNLMAISVLCISFTLVSISMLFTVYIGGTARSGKVVNGEYFIGNHGDFTKVSEDLFNKALLSETVFFYLIFSIFIAGGIHKLVAFFRKKLKA
ncbi:MAG: hypothetical protein ABJN04_12560 [Hyphomicrobiales bacterium]